VRKSSKPNSFVSSDVPWPSHCLLRYLDAPSTCSANPKPSLFLVAQSLEFCFPLVSLEAVSRLDPSDGAVPDLTACERGCLSDNDAACSKAAGEKWDWAQLRVTARTERVRFIGCIDVVALNKLSSDLEIIHAIISQSSQMTSQDHVQGLNYHLPF